MRDTIKPTAIELRNLLMQGISKDELEITLLTLNKVYENARPLVKLQI